jgi:hypothetical protein
MQWVCSVCGYIHDDDEPPDYCYDCGAPGSNFTEWVEDDDVVHDDVDDDFDDDDVDLDVDDADFGDSDDKDKDDEGFKDDE